MSGKAAVPGALLVAALGLMSVMGWAGVAESRPRVSEVGGTAQGHPGDIDLSNEGGLWSISVEAAPIGQVLQAFGRRTGGRQIDIFIFDAYDNDAPVTVSGTGLSLEQAMRRVLKGYDYVMIWSEPPAGPGAVGPRGIRIRVGRNIIQEFRGPQARQIGGYGAAQPVTPRPGPDRHAIARLRQTFGALNGASTEDRVAALKRLGEAEGPELAELLEEVASRDRDPKVRAAAVELLANESAEGGGTASYWAIRTGLRDTDATVRNTALAILGDSAHAMAPEDLAEMSDTLAEMVSTESQPALKGQALQILFEMHSAEGGDDERLATVLEAAANDGDSGTREAALYMMASMGADEVPEGLAARLASTVSRLATDDPDPEVRSGALDALAELEGDAGGYSDSFAAVLRKGVHDRDRSVRERVLERISDLEHREGAATAALEEMAQSDPDPELRAQARELLEEGTEDSESEQGQ